MQRRPVSGQLVEAAEAFLDLLLELRLADGRRLRRFVADETGQDEPQASARAEAVLMLLVMPKPP